MSTEAVKPSRASTPRTSKLDLDQRPGCCAFCDEPLPLGRRPGCCCGSTECVKAYHQAYDLTRRGRKLFSVEGLSGDVGSWFHHLSCGHSVPANTWAQRKSKRRKCPECTGSKESLMSLETP